MDFFISFFGNFLDFLVEPDFSGMDLGLRRAKEISGDFGAFRTRSSPGDHRRLQEIKGDRRRSREIKGDQGRSQEIKEIAGEIKGDHRRSQEITGDHRRSRGAHRRLSRLRASRLDETRPSVRPSHSIRPFHSTPKPLPFRK